MAVNGRFIAWHARLITSESHPLVGGEPARHVLDILLGFPLSRSPTGEVVVHETARADAASVFSRAYERTAATVAMDASRCAHSGAHRTLSDRDQRYIVMTAMVDDAKRALGENDRIDAVWATHRHSHDIQ